MAAVIEMLDRISGPAVGPRVTTVAPEVPRFAAPAQVARESDADRLVKMQRAFCPTGGILSGDEFGLLLRNRTDQPISLLARWIVKRQVVSFGTGSQRWLPMFQFDRETLCVSPPVSDVILELRDVFDDNELTEWFGSPNVWLAGDHPARAIARDAQRVYDTARADRFVAAGQ